MKTTDQRYQQLRQATGLAEDERNALVKYYALLNELEVLDVHALQIDLLSQKRHALKRLGLDPPAIKYATLLVALAKHKGHAWRMSGEAAAAVEHAEQIAAERRQAAIGTKRRRKAKTLKTIRTRFYLIIEDLRKKQFSWRDIAEYLRRYHHSRISHAYLQKSYNLIREEEEKRLLAQEAERGQDPVGHMDSGLPNRP